MQRSSSLKFPADFAEKLKRYLAHLKTGDWSARLEEADREYERNNPDNVPIHRSD